MSYLRPSSEVDLVSPVMACLVAVYGAELGRGTWAEIDPLLMIRPPRGSGLHHPERRLRAEERAGQVDVDDVSATARTVSSSNGTGGAPMPALLKSSRADRTVLGRREQSRTEAASATLVATASAAPAPPRLRRRCSAGARRGARPARRGIRPEAMRGDGLADPLPAPVTIATLDEELMVGAFSFGERRPLSGRSPASASDLCGRVVVLL